MVEDAVTKHKVRDRNATETNGNDFDVTCIVSKEVKVESKCFISTTGKIMTGKGVCKVDGSSHEVNRVIYGVLPGGDVHTNITKNSGGNFDELPATPLEAVEPHVKCIEDSKKTAVEKHVVKVERVKINLESVVKTVNPPVGKVFKANRDVTE